MGSLLWRGWSFSYFEYVLRKLEVSMKITYIHHSSFLVEGSDFYLLFDYFQGISQSYQNKSPFMYLQAIGMETIFPR